MKRDAKVTADTVPKSHPINEKYDVDVLVDGNRISCSFLLFHVSELV